MKAWKSSLLGVAVAFLLILLSSPITLYLAFDRDDALKPAAAGVFGLWIALIVIGAAGGALVPRLFGSVDRDRVAERRRHSRR